VTERLGLIAGSGRLPFEVAEAAKRHGTALSIVAIQDNTDPRIEAVPCDAFTWICAGELGRLLEFLKKSRATEVILAGAVAKQELFRDPARLKPDARAIALLTRLKDLGDDALLRAVAQEIESEGMTVVDSTRHLHDRLTPSGPLIDVSISESVQRDLALGMRVAKTLGIHDVGQTVIVKDATVLALEAIEGTNAAIERGAQLGGAGVSIVKAAKPQQDLRFDVPAIGTDTLALAERLGVAAIGLEVGRTILLERDLVLRRALAAHIAIVGLDVEP